MEPGHEDREYTHITPPGRSSCQASMEPGHEDREYKQHNDTVYCNISGLNGARS